MGQRSEATPDTEKKTNYFATVLMATARKIVTFFDFEQIAPPYVYGTSQCYFCGALFVGS